LLQVDENETLYTSLFNYANNLYFDPDDLKDAVKPLLTENEFERFIRGKDQRGVILFSEYFTNYFASDLIHLIHDYYKLDEQLKSSDDPFYVFESIAKNLTKNELKELLMSGVIFFYNGKEHSMFDEQMWNLIETRLTIPEQKEILVRALGHGYGNNESFATKIREIFFK